MSRRKFLSEHKNKNKHKKESNMSKYNFKDDLKTKEGKLKITGLTVTVVIAIAAVILLINWSSLKTSIGSVSNSFGDTNVGQSFVEAKKIPEVANNSIGGQK